MNTQSRGLSGAENSEVWGEQVQKNWETKEESVHVNHRLEQVEPDEDENNGMYCPMFSITDFK